MKKIKYAALALTVACCVCSAALGGFSAGVSAGGTRKNKSGIRGKKI